MKIKKLLPLFLLPLVCVLWVLWVWLSHTPEPDPTPNPGSPTPTETATPAPTVTAVLTLAPSQPPLRPSVTPTPQDATPTPSHTPEIPTATPTATETAVPTATPGFYVVRWGDNLSDITQDLCGRERPFWLWGANKKRIANIHLILPDWELAIPWPCPR